MVRRTSSGMVTSSLVTRAEIIRPSSIEVKDSRATARVISISGGRKIPVPPGALVSTPPSPTTVRTTAWAMVSAPRTSTLDIR